MATDTKKIYRIQPRADWIKHNEYGAVDVSEHADSPYFYPLVDYQDRVEDAAVHRFCRTVQKINDSSRIEDASLFLRDLHAENEHIIFHGLEIIRDDRQFSALSEDNIEVYQRETSLESHITNRLLTVSLSIDDLRVGDLIDFQTTIVEQVTEHPLWVKHYNATFWLDWDCPVLLEKVRVINQSANALNLHHHRFDDGKQVDNYGIIESSGEFERSYPDLEPKSFEKTAPDWLWTDFLLATTRLGWEDISSYLYRYYREADTSDGIPDLDQIDRIKLRGDMPRDALRIIRFVQNGIRYRGEHHGVYTHTPKSPQYVLHKGSGDCKDKSNLLVALLKAIDVEANLVLVNTRIGKGMNDFKPSAYRFNHMIVRVQIENQYYYFDPTIQKQAGDFAHVAQLDYGYALNLTEPGESLVKLPFLLSRKVFQLKHCFDFRDGDNGNGNLVITRKYFAHRADNMRHYFESNESKKVARDYLRWAKDETSLELSVIKPVSIVKDAINANFLVTEEQYKISNMATTHGDSRVEIGNDFFQDFPFAKENKFPLQITSDGASEHRIEIRYQGKPDIKCSSRGISNSHFTYMDKTWIAGEVLKFKTLLTPHLEVVNQADIKQYRIDVKSMRDRSVSVFPRQAQLESDSDTEHETGPDTDQEISLMWKTFAGALLLTSIVAGLLASG